MKEQDTKNASSEVIGQRSKGFAVGQATAAVAARLQTVSHKGYAKSGGEVMMAENQRAPRLETIAGRVSGLA